MNKIKKLYKEFFGVPGQLTDSSGRVLKNTLPTNIRKMNEEMVSDKEYMASMRGPKPDIDEILFDYSKRPDVNKNELIMILKDHLKYLSGENRDLGNPGMVDEAQLTNHMIDYRGGIEYVLRDPAEAESVATEIQQWSEKKGFTVVNKKISASGKIGYFYFRLGEDPARESQKIQGYISQKPEIKHFRFNVRGESIAPKATPTQAPRQQRPVAPAPTTNPIV